MHRWLAWALSLVVFTCLGTARAGEAREAPGTVVREWIVRWPEQGQRRAVLKRFKAPPGLIRRVRVFIAGEPVAGPPHMSIVGCAAAQRSWLWDGRNVYVTLLLDPGHCRVAGTKERVRVVLTSVGT